MATKIYETGTIYLMDGSEIYLTPLKIKYLREFMDAFNTLKYSKNASNSEQDSMADLAKCALIAMKQYRPSITTIDEFEDSVDLESMYTILKIGGGVNMNRDKDKDDPSIKNKVADSEGSWENLDLATLEAEAFLLGIWKDYEDLETSLSMPELVATLESKRKVDYEDKKFHAAMQGVDLDEQTGRKKDDPWEAMKARVFSGGNASNSNDIVALQGANASKAGFGIGMGLDYERID